MHSPSLVSIGRNWQQHTNILWLGCERLGALFEEILAGKPSCYFWQVCILLKQKTKAGSPGAAWPVMLHGKWNVRRPWYVCSTAERTHLTMVDSGLANSMTQSFAWRVIKQRCISSMNYWIQSTCSDVQQKAKTCTDAILHTWLSHFNTLVYIHCYKCLVVSTFSIAQMLLPDCTFEKKVWHFPSLISSRFPARLILHEFKHPEN